MEADSQRSSWRESLWRLLCSNTSKLYLEQALSSWGDRMWNFAVGLYLVMLSPNSLRLTAIYGFTSCISVIIFGAPIGKWIDRTSRLTAARISLILQNSFVALCAILLCLAIHFEKEITGNYEVLMHWLIISVAVLCDLASAAGKISVGKDWVAVIAKDNKSLGYMNAMVRRIDLTSLICAPIITGQIMTYLSMMVAAIVIATWNVVSMFLEFFLLSNLYRSVPDLAVRKRQKVPTIATVDVTDANAAVATSDSASTRSYQTQNFCKTYVRSWKLYFKQELVFAGFGLAFLYMTVLGFDSITQGYAHQQGVSASVLGGLSAIGAVVGILGTLAYPRMRDHIGIIRTGLYGFLFEISCLTLCVISVWMPGSPFDPYTLCYRNSLSKTPLTTLSDESLMTWATTTYHQHFETTTTTAFTFTNSGRVERYISEMEDKFNDGYVLAVNESLPDSKRFPDKNYTSIALLMTGIVTARFGLWMADLTVNQLFQEKVLEQHRGTVNGVQHSLNMVMNMLKFILVICFPCHETFGYLIIISFIFIFAGWMFYCVYSYKQRGHILPWHKKDNYNQPLTIPNNTASTTESTHL